MYRMPIVRKSRSYKARRRTTRNYKRGGAKIFTVYTTGLADPGMPEVWIGDRVLSNILSQIPAAYDTIRVIHSDPAYSASIIAAIKSNDSALPRISNVVFQPVLNFETLNNTTKDYIIIDSAHLFTYLTADPSKGAVELNPAHDYTRAIARHKYNLNIVYLGYLANRNNCEMTDELFNPRIHKHKCFHVHSDGTITTLMDKLKESQPGNLKGPTDEVSDCYARFIKTLFARIMADYCAKSGKPNNAATKRFVKDLICGAPADSFTGEISKAVRSNININTLADKLIGDMMALLP